MKQSTKAVLLTAALVALLALGWAQRVGGVSRETPPPEPPKPSLSHAQLVWAYALEWCESNGLPSAVNPEDRDGTPSYGSYQFKPSTLALYAKIYDVAASSSVMDYPTQRSVVEAMLLHRRDINWHQQFPDCTRKLGLPPA